MVEAQCLGAGIHDDDDYGAMLEQAIGRAFRRLSTKALRRCHLSATEGFALVDDPRVVLLRGAQGPGRKFAWSMYCLRGRRRRRHICVTEFDDIDNLLGDKNLLDLLRGNVTFDEYLEQRDRETRRRLWTGLAFGFAILALAAAAVVIAAVVLG